VQRSNGLNDSERHGSKDVVPHKEEVHFGVTVEINFAKGRTSRRRLHALFDQTITVRDDGRNF
jgi:hypothetical protein